MLNIYFFSVNFALLKFLSSLPNQSQIFSNGFPLKNLAMKQTKLIN